MPRTCLGIAVIIAMIYNDSTRVRFACIRENNARCRYTVVQDNSFRGFHYRVRAFKCPSTVMYCIVKFSVSTDGVRISQDCRATSEPSALLSTSAEGATYVKRKLA